LRRVLVVDESISVRKAVERLLAQEGYLVETVKTLQTARQRWQNGEPFHLVICDTVLPDGDLLALSELLRSDTRHSTVPILCLTTSYDDQVRMKADLAGAAAVLRKPFAADEFLSVLGGLLQNSAPDEGMGADLLSRAAAGAAHLEAVRETYEEAADWRGLVFAILLSSGGQELAQVRGRDAALDDDRVEDLRKLGVDLAARLRNARMTRMTIEGDDATLFVDRLAHGDVQVLAASREVLLGMGRLYARKLSDGTLAAAE
jgi:CheY-like chemotaxis protein